MRRIADMFVGLVLAHVLAGAPLAVHAQETGRAVDREDAEAARLEQQAEADIRAGSFASAQTALEESLARPENHHTPRALELSAVVRERQGKPDEARRIYDDYLARYGRDDGADRVRQRLAALAPASHDADLPSDVPEKRWHAAVKGAVAQYYLSDRSRSNFDSSTDVDAITATDRRVNVDELLSTTDFTLSAVGEATRIEARISAAYVAEYRPVTLVGADRNQGSYPMLYERSLYVQNDTVGLSAKLGRQTRFTDGIFGRFDGALVGWQFAPRFKLNAFEGSPVWTPRQTGVDDTRTFRGASFEYGSESQSFWTSVHWLEQTTADLTDRRSIGADFRIRSSRASYIALVDYDTKFDQLNAAYGSATFGLENSSTLSITAELLHYPTLALSNSVIGQPTPTIEAIRNLYDVDALQQLARDRTMTARDATVTYSRALGSKWEVVADATVSRTSGSPESAGVPSFPGSGVEHFEGVQLIGTGLVGSRDTWIVGLRHASLQFADVTLVDFTTSLPLTPRFTIVPRLQFLDTDQSSDPGWSRNLRPSVRFVYNITRRAQVDASIGANFIDQSLVQPVTAGQHTERASLVNIGWRMLF
jgi:hypothetical protein